MTAVLQRVYRAACIAEGEVTGEIVRGARLKNNAAKNVAPIKKACAQTKPPRLPPRSRGVAFSAMRAAKCNARSPTSAAARW